MSDFEPPPLPPAEPPPPPPPGPPPRRGIPWDERDRIGLATGLLETLKLVLFDPTAFFRAMPTSGGLSGPLTFGLVVGYLGLAVAAFYQAIFQSFGGGMIGDFGRRGEFERFSQMFGGMFGFVVSLIIGPFVVLFGLFIWSGIIHLMLMLLSAAKQDYEATFRVVSFAQAAAVFLIVPFCGQFVQPLYQLVLVIIGLAEAHKISYLTAAAAVLLPVVLFCCCCLVLVGTMLGGIAGMAGLPQ